MPKPAVRGRFRHAKAQGDANLPTIVDELAEPMVVAVLLSRSAHERILHRDDALVSFSIGGDGDLRGKRGTTSEPIWAGQMTTRPEKCSFR